MDRPKFSPLSLTGGSIGCLLVHGFTSCPLDIRPLTKFLYRRGFTVREVLLPGHGTSYQDMARFGGRDWLAAVETELAELQQQCTQVWLLGFSLGGILTAIVASRQRVQGLVCIAAPIWLRPKRTRYASFMQFFQKYAQMGNRQQYQFPSWRYEQVAVKNIVDLNNLIRRAKRTFAGIHVPSLVIQGNLDCTIQVRSANYIYNKLGASAKELFMVEGGAHMLLLEPVSAQVCAKVESFISLDRR